MKIDQLKAGVALSYMSMALGYLVSIIYTPVMLRLLGQSEYGLYNLVASIVAYLGVLKFGFGSAYMRYYSRYKVQEDKERIATLNGIFLLIFSAIGFVAVIAGIVLAMNTEVIFGSELTSIELSRAKILMMILVINLAISFPNIVFTSHITANERFVFQKLVQMIKTLVNPFIVLPVLILGYGSIGMVVTTTILSALIEIINATYCIRTLRMRFSFKNFDFKLISEMTAFSSFIFINLIADQINWNIDKFILGRYRGTVPVAVYGLASQLNVYYISIATTLSNVFIPRVHRLVTNSDNNSGLTKLFTKIGRIQFIILSLISSGLLFFGKPFIKFWAGNSYENSYPIALLLIIPVTIELIQKISIEIQRAKNMHKFRSWVYFFIALLNLFITIPLVKIFGGLGAAIGTAIAMIIGNGLLMNWYNHVKVGLDMIYFWRQIFIFIPALIIPFIIGVLANLLLDLDNLVTFLFSGLIYVIIFGISMWFIGMNQYEKDLLGRPIKRLTGRLFCK